MKKNDTINIIFLFLCILLLGFVYLNSLMMDEVTQQQQLIKFEIKDVKGKTAP